MALVAKVPTQAGNTPLPPLNTGSQNKKKKAPTQNKAKTPYVPKNRPSPRSSTPRRGYGKQPMPPPIPASAAPTPASSMPPAPGSPAKVTIVETRQLGQKPQFQPQQKNVKPDLIMAFLLALIVVNGFSSGQFQAIGKVLTKQNTDATSVKHSVWILGGEIAFVIGLSMISQISDGAANFILVFAFALWALWGVQNVKHIQNFAKGVSANK